MSADWPESRGRRFDPAHDRLGRGPSFPTTPTRDGTSADALAELDATMAARSPEQTRLHDAIGRTRDYLFSIQHDDGFWCGELEGDTILESEYILLLTHLGRGQSEQSQRCANYIRQQQLPDGAWAIYPDGPLEISASVKAYFALKIVGDSADAEHMVRARNAILAAGGAEKVNSFTRFYLALLGVISYEQCPAVPPEVVLLPKWMPFNISEMSAWSRTIIVPLSLMWAFRPVTGAAGRARHSRVVRSLAGRVAGVDAEMRDARRADQKNVDRLGGILPPCRYDAQDDRPLAHSAAPQASDREGDQMDARSLRRQRRTRSDLSADCLEHRRGSAASVIPTTRRRCGRSCSNWSG